MMTIISADFSQVDSFATTIALVGYLVVFIALVLLYFVFYKLPVVLKFDYKKIFVKKRSNETEKAIKEVNVTGEINAAIAASIYLYLNELHDKESGVITIKKISKRYSPWSSKIYGLRHYPR